MAKSFIHRISRIKLLFAPSNKGVANVIVQDAITKELHSIPKTDFNKGIQDQLDGLLYPDGILKYGTVVIVGNNATIAANSFNWRKNKVAFLNPAAFSAPLVLATDGFYRSNMIVGDAFGNYHLVAGSENAIAAPEPIVPSGTIKLALIPIYGAIAGTPELVVDISGKEDTANKSNDIEADKTSTFKYGSVAAFIFWLLTYWHSNISAKATAIVDADTLSLGDSEDSFKTKKRTFLQIYNTIKGRLDLVYKSWILSINSITGITYTVAINDYKTKNIFTNTNPVAFTVPTNTSVAVPIGTKFSYTVQGAGTVTVGGAGITFVQKNLVYTTGDTFTLEKINTDTWAVNGNLPVAGAKVPYTAFIDTLSGNDTSGRLEDATKPFLTDTAAFTALPTNNGIPWTFYYIDSGVTRTLSVLSLNRAILYKCDTAGTFDISATPSGIYTSFYFDCPKSTIKHIGSTAYIAYSVASTNSHLFKLRCKQLWVEAIQMYFSMNALDSVIETEEFYHRNSTNSPIGSGTIKVTKWNTTCAKLINTPNASAPLDLKIYEFFCATNVLYYISKAMQDFPIQKITGTGTVSTGNITNVDVTYLEVVATANINVSGTTVLRGKQSGLFLGTIIIDNQNSTIAIQDFYGRITVPTGNNTYGVAFNISRSHINLAGALIASNPGFAWVAKTSKIENSTFIQDTPQPLFANFNAATLMTIELYGKNYSNGTLHDGGAAFTVIDKTPNLLS